MLKISQVERLRAEVEQLKAKSERHEGHSKQLAGYLDDKIKLHMGLQDKFRDEGHNDPLTHREHFAHGLVLDNTVAIMIKVKTLFSEELEEKGKEG